MLLLAGATLTSPSRTALTAELGSVFYSVKEKNFDERGNRRKADREFSKKAELETEMARQREECVLFAGSSLASTADVPRFLLYSLPTLARARAAAPRRATNAPPAALAPQEREKGAGGGARCQVGGWQLEDHRARDAPTHRRRCGCAGERDAAPTGGHLVVLG